MHAPVLALLLIAAPAEDPRPALSIRLVHPDRQLERLLGLFDGTRAPHPAAALSAWRRATGSSLGKSAEALIAAFNPGMVSELRGLHDAEFRLRLGPARWSATVPHDDGSLAAIATALALTDGERLELIGDAAVDRLGLPGAPLMAADGREVVIATDVEALREGLADREQGAGSTIDSGVIARLDPEALEAGGPLARRRIAAALRGAGCTQAKATGRLQDSSYAVTIVGTYDPPVPDGPASPSGLARRGPRRPGDRRSGLGPRARSGHAGPSVRGRRSGREGRSRPIQGGAAPGPVEPARAGRRRPSRDRPLAETPRNHRASHSPRTAAGCRAACWPCTRSTSRPPIASPRRRSPASLAHCGSTSPEAAHWTSPGTGRPYWSAGVKGASRPASRAEVPDRSAGPTLRAAWASETPSRSGILWPGRLPGIPTEWARSLMASSPVVWWGVDAGEIARDELRWPGLDMAVRRFLERLPLAPPSQQ